MLPHIKLLLISLNLLGRAPIPGEAKTRLIPLLGEKGASDAHEKLLTHVASVTQTWCNQSSNRTFQLWCTPTTQHPFFATLTPNETLRLQIEGDLGKRMAHIVHQENSPVLLLGSDAVSITSDLLDQAESYLKTHDAVIAGAEDGGYVLLGLKNTQPDCFRNIHWGTDQVLNQTRERFKQLNITWAELPEQWDVDTPQDWLRFCGLPEKKV